MSPGKRPPGMIVLCALLAWSILSDVTRWPHLITSFAHGQGPHGWFDRATVALLFATPLGAIPALVGLWRLRRWAVAAFGVWAILSALQTGFLLFMVGAMGGVHALAWIAVGAVWAVAIGILLALWFYVRRVIGSSSAAGPGA